jgi:hypothetical protein
MKTQILRTLDAEEIFAFRGIHLMLSFLQVCNATFLKIEIEEDSSFPGVSNKLRFSTQRLHTLQSSDLAL